MEKLIFDRTNSDLINSTTKAYYNFEDLNRVEAWCEYLAEILNKYSYLVDIEVKKDWSMSQFPTHSELERIRVNINRLKQAYFSFTQIPENLEYMTWQKANDIEKILYEIDKILKHMENNFIYSGVANCGQNRLWQQRFRRKYSYFNVKKWADLMQLYWSDFNVDDTWKGVSLVATNYES